jgi:hypothetical protein
VLERFGVGYQSNKDEILTTRNGCGVGRLCASAVARNGRKILSALWVNTKTRFAVKNGPYYRLGAFLRSQRPRGLTCLHRVAPSHRRAAVSQSLRRPAHVWFTESRFWPRWGSTTAVTEVMFSSLVNIFPVTASHNPAVLFHLPVTMC